MPRCRAYIAIAVLFLFGAGRARAQNISDLLEDLGIQQMASGYLRPAADAIGYSFNSGLYHTAEVKKGAHVWVGVRGVWTFVPDNQKTFTATTPQELRQYGYAPNIETATVVGDKGAVLRSTNSQYPDIQLPDGINQQSVYFAMPHITVGSIAGFEVMLRGIPPVTFDPNVGKVSFIGAGLKFSPTSLMRGVRKSRLNIAFMGAVQQFKAGEYVTVSNYNINFHGSLDLGVLTAYSGLGYEGYDIDASYTYTPTASNLPGGLNTKQKIDLTFFRTNLRYTIGANLTLIPMVNICADYSFGVQDNFSFGAGITF